MREDSALFRSTTMRSQRRKKQAGLKPGDAVYPPAERITDEEFRRRLATIEEWRQKELAAFKKEHPDYFADQD